MQAIAYYSLTAFDGIEILDVIHDTDDYIKFRWSHNGETDKPHRAKVKYNREGRAYFNTYKLSIPLDECIRIEGRA